MQVVTRARDSSPGFPQKTNTLTASVLRADRTLLRVTRHIVSIIVGLAVLACGAISSLARPVSFNVNGTVTGVDPLLASFFSVGDSMTSSFTYESSVSNPLVCQPAICAFDAVTKYSFTVGSFSAAGTSGQVQLMNFYPLFTPADEIAFLGTNITSTLPGWRSDREFVVDLSDTTGKAIKNEFTLPSNLKVTDYTSNRWFLGFSRVSDGQFAFVTGSVPEPDMLWPTLAGLLVIGVFFAHRRRCELRCN